MYVVIILKMLYIYVYTYRYKGCLKSYYYGAQRSALLTDVSQTFVAWSVIALALVRVLPSNACLALATIDKSGCKYCDCMLWGPFVGSKVKQGRTHVVVILRIFWANSTIYGK